VTLRAERIDITKESAPLRSRGRNSAVLLLAFSLALSLASTAWAADVKLTPDQLDFFEKHIRPIFTDNCYKCHSHESAKVKGGLMLDTRDDLRKGGDTGLAIVPGDSEKSLLIKAVRYTDKDLQMPPNDNQLAAAQIHDLEAWVKMGAPDPRTEIPQSHKYTIDFTIARRHWSFEPVADPPVPHPEDPNHWAKSPIDEFILAAQATNNVIPAPAADKVTLLRRATFDLIGLPPSEQEVGDFLADDSPTAFAKVVDRLLASPHYGERWGRYWLDLAHYADTKGSGNQGDTYAYAYVYRDYVIRAFNEDLPYDQFIIQQIAADKLPLGDDKRPLAAMGFLTLGNRTSNQPNDIIDDHIDVISKSMLALTVTCARCHDHKFDPIPTTDYYALHGVFNSSYEPTDDPLLETPDDTPVYRDFVQKYTACQTALQNFRIEETNKIRAEMFEKSGDYLFALHDYYAKSNAVSRNIYVEKRGLNAQTAAIWDNNLKAMQRRHNPIFAPWIELSALSDDDFTAQVKDLAAKYHANTDRTNHINPVVADFFSTPPASLGQVAARYTQMFADVDKHWREMESDYDSRKKMDETDDPEPKGLPDAGEEQVRQFLIAPNSPFYLDDNRINNLINRDNKLKNTFDTLTKAENDVVVSHPGSPARAPVLEDMDKPRDSYVFVKGNPGVHGPAATRHFLTILSPGDNPPLFKSGSGRLELAEDIASKDNPLTARVMVNRIWLHHFGDGLVRTPDDFGERGEAPTHPELLDYLASQFMQSGWSIKAMHRMIMLSAVYQQSSEGDPKSVAADPENRWWDRMNRRRLDFEALRDSILAVGGDLDMKMGGKPVRLDTEPFALRRTIYGFVDRRNVPNMYQAFDFASPDLTTGRRETSVVPQQALFMMNSPLVVEQSRNIVRNLKFKPDTPVRSRIKMMYELLFQREPTEAELDIAMDYVRSDSAAEWQTNASAAWSYGYGEYDAETHHLNSYAGMGAFANKTWTPGNKVPNARLNGLNLTPDGGRPNEQVAVIRRWTSPREGYISVEGTLTDSAKKGVLGRVVSARSGELGNWQAPGGPVDTKLAWFHVAKGEVIDFVTGGPDAGGGEAFKWTVQIKMAKDQHTPKDGIIAWDTQKDFSGESEGRRMGPLEKLAQVLLETNEMMYVD
jgi:mono/diheme cytochrome c family protein